MVWYGLVHTGIVCLVQCGMVWCIQVLCGRSPDGPIVSLAGCHSTASCVDQDYCAASQASRSRGGLVSGQDTKEQTMGVSWELERTG